MNNQHLSLLTTDKRRGFTLLEILVVLSIVVLTLSIVSFRYWKRENISLHREKDKLSLLLKYYFYKAYTEKRDFEGKLKPTFFSIREGENEIYIEKFPLYIEAYSKGVSDTFLISRGGYVTPFSFSLRDKEGNTLPLTITPLGRVEERED